MFFIPRMNQKLKFIECKDNVRKVYDSWKNAVLRENRNVVEGKVHKF